jgi:hypothetical protein
MWRSDEARRDAAGLAVAQFLCSAGLMADRGFGRHFKKPRLTPKQQQQQFRQHRVVLDLTDEPIDLT